MPFQDTATIKHVQDPWFTHIQHGRKNIEGRLKHGGFENLKKGDIIAWTDGKNQIKTKIVKVYHHQSFHNMLKYHGLKKTLPGVKNLKDGVAVYRGFYTQADENKYGVLAIKIRRILKNHAVDLNLESKKQE